MPSEVSAPAAYTGPVHGHGSCPKYNFSISEVVKAHVAPSPKYPETLHYTDDGSFMLPGRVVDRRSWFRRANL